MATLATQKPSDTFDSLLHVEDDTAGLVASSTDSRIIQDGVGTASALALATDSVRITSTNKLYFNDVGDEWISSDGTDLTINAGTDINLPSGVGLTFGNDGEKIEGDGTDLTITGNIINLSPTADVAIPVNKGITFGTHEKIESDDTDLTITVGSGGDINIGSGIGLTFGNDGEKIEGDGTDLTISGNNINLTADADVVIPADVGITFGSGEKIEGDGDDLTLTSGRDIILAATNQVVLGSGIELEFGGVGSGEHIVGDGTDLSIVGARGIEIGYSTSTVTGTVAISLGAANTIAGSYSVAAGANCVNAGNYSFTTGRYCDTTASKDFAFASGKYAVATNYGQMSRASGRIAADGDAQHSTYIFRNRSTDTTDVELFLNGSDERFVIPQDCTLIFWGYVLGRDTNHAGESFGYKIEGILSRAGSGNPALLEGATVTVIYEESSIVDPVISIDTTNDSLKIVCDAAANRNWVAVVHTLEVIGQE